MRCTEMSRRIGVRDKERQKEKGKEHKYEGLKRVQATNEERTRGRGEEGGLDRRIAKRTT